jgi:6-phosphogluconolactonase/glucosamine-6-phosphate isomerase/deaminase
MSHRDAPALVQRIVGPNVWLAEPGADADAVLSRATPRALQPDVLPTEEAVGRAMLEELESAAGAKSGDIVIALLGGRGAQALHRLLGEKSKRGDLSLISRLHVFTQDALGPMRPDNGFSFVRDFERLLGLDFFRQVKSFTTFRTDSPDLEAEVNRYVARLAELGGLDIFFLGHGPEAEAASHLAYIKPGSGATAVDVAGLIPISSSILEHHVSKFKAGGSVVNDADEAECRRATHILTLGPAAILGAKRIVQSVVDASTAPAKKASYRRVLETTLAANPSERARQLDANPGLWVRLHPNLRSIILPDVLEGTA